MRRNHILAAASFLAIVTLALTARSGRADPQARLAWNGHPIFQLDPFRGWYLVGWSFPNCITPAQRPTWGQIKALYR